VARSAAGSGGSGQNAGDVFDLAAPTGSSGGFEFDQGSRNTLRAMHTTFNDVLWVVCGLGFVIALLALMGTGKTWEEYGKRGLLMERESGGGGSAMSAAALVERDEEIRQMLEARNARRARRGETPLDIEMELKRLTAPVISPGLREEVRDLVVARNHRRARRGQPPLDIEAEVERELANLTSL
jgi:hypothetical protein